MSLARVIWCFVPLALSFFLVIMLEEKINRWFAPFSGASPASPAPSVDAGPSPGAPRKKPRTDRTRFKLVLDPGHGGRGERRSQVTGDNWDSSAAEFLTPYMNGGSRTVNKISYTEHEVVLALGKRIKLWLDKTNDDKRWPEFETLIKRYTDLTKQPIKRIWIDTKLMREFSYVDHPDAANPNVNKYFRLFDGPDVLPWTPGGSLYPGRLTQINQVGADLLVALHINDSINTTLRGSTALFVPPFQVYDQVRQIPVNPKAYDDFRSSPYYTYWSYTKAPGRRREELVEDATRYFLDGVTPSNAATTRQRIGRADRIGWKYRRPTAALQRTEIAGKLEGPYWDRERSAYEAYRRNAGPEEIGGDNLFAGQELIRFLRYALWQDFLKKPGPLPFPAQPLRERRGVDPDAPPPDQGKAGAAGLATSYGLPFPPEAYLGRHAPPLCSDWLVSLYTNSVAAYLEVAYLSNPADLWLLDHKLDVIAEGVAVGIYSLFVGMKTKDLPGLQSPRGVPLDWDRYYETPWGKSWFEMARPDGASR